jgi:hypothetical protein
MFKELIKLLEDNKVYHVLHESISPREIFGSTIPQFLESYYNYDVIEIQPLNGSTRQYWFFHMVEFVGVFS